MPNGFLDELKKWETETTFWVSEEEKARAELVRLQAEPPHIVERIGAWIGKVAEIPFAVPYRMIRAAIGKPVPPEPEIRGREFVAQQEVWKNTINQANRANFFTTLYQTAPMGISTGRVTSFEDFMTQLPGGISEGTLSDTDVAQAKDIIDRMVTSKTPETPEWLGITPEKAEVIEEFLTAPMPTRPRFKGVHLTTVEEMVKWLKREVPTPELPTGMTAEELLASATVMGLTEEQLTTAMDYDEMMEVVGQAWGEQQKLIDDVKAGALEYEMPKLTGWEKAKFVALQPFQTLADVIMPYLKYFNYPVAGSVVATVQQLMPGLQEYEKLYDEARTTENWYMAHSKAWEEWDANWGAKLAIEIAADPLTYVGIGIYTKITKPLGRLGRAVASAEKGFNYAADIPFQWVKTKWANIPRATSQVMRAEQERFTATIHAATAGYVKRFKGGAKTVLQFTKDDYMDTIKFSLDHYAKHPELALKGTDDYFAEFGKYLTDIAPVTPDNIASWTKTLDGKLLFSEITGRTIDDVNNLIYDLVVKKGSLEENASKLFGIVMAEKTAPRLKRATLLLARHTNQFAKRVETLGALEKPAEILRALSVQQRKIIDAQVRSQFYNSRMEHGIVAGMMNHVTQMESTWWRNRLDRWFVRPMAEAYLGFPSYPAWNAFEDMFRSVIEGVLPRQMSLEHFQLVIAGINVREARLITGGASDVMGMLGGMPGRAGTVSFLPGKVPEVIKVRVPLAGKHVAGAEITEWLGRNWVELSNVWGNAFRRNFMVKKYLQYLAIRGRDVAGKDVTKIFDDLINRAGRVPKVRTMKSDALRNEAFARVQTSDRKVVLEMKESINNTTLMMQEQRKILYQADELTPQAKTLGEQMIATGEAIDNPTAFAKALADQSIADIKVYPIQIADNFEYMADHIAAETLATPDDLMQAYQHLVIMQDTAGAIPHRLMSKTHAEADALMAQGKYGRVIDQLWRRDRTELVDIMDRIGVANQKVRQKILDSIPDVKLATDQDYALRQLLEHANVRDTLKASAREMDSSLLDDFWAMPKTERTKGAYETLRAERSGLWDAYRKSDAEYFGNEFIMRTNLSELYSKLPRRPPLSVDASARDLVPNDIARVLDCNVDSVSTAITENVVLHDRYHFTQLIKKIADSKPAAFKGFTEDKIHSVYDIILDNMRITPDVDIQIQKALMQIKGLEHEMMTLKQLKGMSKLEEKEFFKWVDNIAGGMDEMMYEPALVKALPKVEIESGLIIDPKEPGEKMIKVNKAGEEASGLVYNDSGKVIRMDNLWTNEGFKRQGYATKAILELIDVADSQGKVLGSGALTEQGLALLKGAEKQGFIKLNPPVKGGGDFTIVKVVKPPAKVLKPEFQDWDTVRQGAWDEAIKDYYKAFTDYSHENVIDHAMRHIFPYWGKDIEFTPNHRWLIINSWSDKAKIKRGYELKEVSDLIPRALPHNFPNDSILSPRDAAILGWLVTDGYVQRSNGRKPNIVIYQSIHKYLSEIEDLLWTEGYPRTEGATDWVVKAKQIDSDRILAICPDKEQLPEIIPKLSQEAAEAMWDAMFKAEGSDWNGNKCFIQNPGKVMDAFQMLSILLGKAITVGPRAKDNPDGIGRVNILNNHKPYHAKQARRMFTKHYKGKVWCPVTPSGTWFMNCNGSIMPTGNTYESQRWFFLPRTFVRRPGVLAAWGKYSEYSEHGYVPIPGTDIQVNLARGSIFGLTFGLTRRDYPRCPFHVSNSCHASLLRRRATTQPRRGYASHV